MELFICWGVTKGKTVCKSPEGTGENQLFYTDEERHATFNIETLKKSRSDIKHFESLMSTRDYAYNLLCEPKLNNYNLRAPISFKTSYKYDKILLNILFFANGKRDLIELASKIKADIFVVEDIVKKLLKAGLLKKIN